MGRASSAKKVARAASVGQSSRTGERRIIGFPAAVVATIVLGFALVAFAASNRDSVPQPTLQDHWHSAYGVYDCQTESFLEPFGALVNSQGQPVDPDGIHSHEDGLIHIHPFTSSVTGSGAQMSVFFETVGIELTDDTLSVPGGVVYSEADITCDGEPVTLQVLRWSRAAEAADTEPEVITEDLSDVVFEADGEAFTIAVAPLGADIPPPETIARLLTVNPSLIDPGTGPAETDADADLGTLPEADAEPDDGADADGGGGTITEIDPDEPEAGAEGDADTEG